MKNVSNNKKTAFSPTISFILPDSIPNHQFNIGSSTPSSISSRSKESSSIGRSLTSNFMYTPITTSAGVKLRVDGNSMRVSTSQSISESFKDIAVKTVAELEEVWENVGYTTDERATQLSDLLADFRNLCSSKVAYEMGVAETFRQTILDSKIELKSTSQALKVDFDVALLEDNDGSMTLQDELANLESALDKLRLEANAVKKSLLKYKEELINAHEALGMELESDFDDVTSDLTSARVEIFRRKLEETRTIVATRTTAIVQLLSDCKDLLVIMKMDVCQNPLDRKIMESLVINKDGMVSLRSISASENCVGINAVALEQLTLRVSELNGEKRRRKNKIADMGNAIAELWEKLHVPREDQEHFANSISSLGVLSMETIEKGEQELERLHRLKNDMMGKLIIDSREKIYQLWDETNATDQIRSQFKSIDIDDDELFNDALLTEHENYIQILENRLELMRPILQIIERREEIIDERMEYEELQKDPERLQQRGSALTKQLMKEEKMSKRIKKDLPRYTELIEKKLKEWQDMNGDSFLYKGRPYLEIIRSQEEEWRQYKDNETQQKLRKKQEEYGAFHPIVQKKKDLSAIRGYNSASGPLSDSTNKPRSTSTCKSRDPVKPQITSQINLPKKYDSSQRSTSTGRAISTGRARPTTRP
jgi:protein regulator of cytokinesis 1